jgi:immunity protein Imm1 of predicted polymorphic toxin system
MEVAGDNQAYRLVSFDPEQYWIPIEEEFILPEQVLRRMQEIEGQFVPGREESTSVRIETMTGDAMEVGLGGDEWIILYIGSDGTCLVTLGDETRTGYKVFLRPEWTECDQLYLIPAPTGRRVVRTWLETGELSDEVKWTT